MATPMTAEETSQHDFGTVIVEVDPEIADLVPEYLERRRAEIAGLRELLAGEDHGALKVAGHRLAGSGGTYGFDAITMLGRALERAAAGGDARAARDAIDDIEEYLRQVRVVAATEVVS